MENQEHYLDSYAWNEHGLPLMEGEVGPPGDDVRNYHRDYKDRDYRSQEYTNREYDRDYERDYSREYDRDDQDRERRRRSRSRSRSHDRRRKRDRRKRGHSSDSGSSRSRSRSRDRRRRSRSRERNKRDRPTYDYEHRERDYERSDSWRTIPPNNTIMVSNMPLHVTENEIRTDILQHGLVPKDIRLIRRKDTGASRGFAFVEFSTLPEAVRWMEAKQGYLVLEDQFRATLQYSISKDASSDKAAKAAQDWFCVNCGEHNFKRREVCFKCQSPRCESDLANDVQKEISVYPTSTVLLRNLDVLTDEDKVLNFMQSLPGVGSLPIRSVRIGRDSLTNTSRGVCYLDMNNTADAMRLFAGLSEAGVLEIDGKEVMVSYCKLASSKTTAATVAAIAAKASTPAAMTAVAAAQWSVSNANNGSAAASTSKEVNFTVEEIPRLAEYSASMYAKTPEEHASYLQYYTQYYTQQLQASTPQIESVAPPDMAKFVYDDKSGYYYDSVTKLYYDSNTQYFYNSQTQMFSYWDNEKQNYVPVANSDSKTNAPVVDKEDRREKPEKQDKVTVAKKIAMDMEKWAKTLNQRKESTKVPVQPPASEPERRRESEPDTEKGSLQEVLQVLQRKQTADKKPVDKKAVASAAIVAAYGSDSDSDNAAEDRKPNVDSLVDWNKLACLLCKRQFANKETLTKHQQLSDLHKQNLEMWKKQNAPIHYRDRAKERRLKFGDTESPQPHRFKDSVMKTRQDMGASNYSQPSQSGLTSGNNVGSKLLQKMGWQEGQGLGKTNQGRTTIIEAERRSATAGLGMKTYSVAGDNYRESVKKLAIMRFKELNDD